MEKKDMEESIERLAAICRISFSDCQSAIDEATASYRRESQKVQRHFQSERDRLCRGVRKSHILYDDFILPDNTIEAFSRGEQPEDVRAADIFRSSVPARKRNRKSKAKKSPKRFF
jgi:hypothetical protein